jgi:hypothetical protein
MVTRQQRPSRVRLSQVNDAQSSDEVSACHVLSVILRSANVNKAIVVQTMISWTMFFEILAWRSVEYAFYNGLIFDHRLVKVCVQEVLSVDLMTTASITWYKLLSPFAPRSLSHLSQWL